MVTEIATIRFTDERVELAHGAGGKASRRLIEGLLLPHLSNAILDELGDAAHLEVHGAKLAMTADSFVVKPLAFPGGSIGELAVNGTINDLAVSGAKPLALVMTLILEAGLSTSVLEREIAAIADAARRAGVLIIGGDTKVVEHGKADGMYITTAGIGTADSRVHLSPTSVRDGDKVLLSGPVGDHGITVLLARGEIDLEADLRSDTRSVWPLVNALIDVAASGVRWMRDPTRGGVATALNELARAAKVAIALDEESVPVRAAVRGACEILGLDPLHIACEGQFIAVVAPERAQVALEALRRASGGEGATIIGEVRESPAGLVIARSAYGGSRVVDMLVGDPLPRIC
ncbi:MAG: hydrogenase expression/formation protein HypE [Pyrinomonas sp.]|uniref:hydrogenase expression/formation protein HypE n=1 Tax=Pyrinomonas sp. TaxID=2080306 RepID=UPI0033260F0C